MNDSELEQLLIDLESDRVERKRALPHDDSVREAICAFANDLPGHGKPGVIFVGANDDGSVAELEVTDRLLLTLSDMRSDGNILPLPAMTVQKRLLCGCEMAVIVVEPADAPPVRLKGRVWVRVGPRRAVASQQEECILAERRRSRDLPFDVRPLRGATLADLDRRVFQQEYLPSAISSVDLEQNNRSFEQQLASVRFTTPPPDLVPTPVGILTVGIEPRDFFPGASIQFLRIDGRALSDPIKDAHDIGGPVSQVFRTLDEVFRANIATAVGVTEADRETRSADYPLSALQQIARNAVIHRTYEGTNAPVRVTWFEDRIEIQNPGGPFGVVRIDNFGEPGVTDYRNPHLAEAVKTLGYVQRFGVGIQIARREMEKNGNPPPEFDVSPSHVMVVLRRRQ